MLIDEEYLEKLTRVLSSLLHHGSHRLDDTCLQKLLDNTRDICTESANTALFKPFLEEVNLSPYTDTDDNVKTFAVRLFGVLGENEDAFCSLLRDETLSKFYEKFSDNLSNQDLSVLSAVFICMRGIIKHNAGLIWFLQSAEKDLLDTAFSVMKTGKSLFVISSVQTFVVDLWSRAIKLASSEDGSEKSALCGAVQGKIEGELWTMVKATRDDSPLLLINGIAPVRKTGPGSRSALEVLKQFYEEFEGEHIPVKKDKLDVLLDCLSVDPSTVTTVLDILEIWYSQKVGVAADEFEQCVISTVQKLLDNRQVGSALTVAQRFFYKFSADNRAWLQDVALAPVHSVVCVDTPPSRVRQLIRSHMEGPGPFTHALSSAISTVLHLTDQVLLDTLGVIVRILHLTVEQGVPSPGVQTRHLQQNTVIQRVVLQTVRNCLDSRLAGVRCNLRLVTDISRSLLTLTEDSQTPVQILMVLFKTWRSLLCLYCDLKPNLPTVAGVNGEDGTDHSKGDNSQVHNDGDNTMESVLDKLSLCVEKKMCDLQWEVRDSAVEFLTRLLSIEGGHAVVEWFQSHRLHVSLWQCVRDQESYVRATALRGLQSLLQSHQLWRHLQHHVNTAELVSKVVDIVLTDSEAFPRRAGVNLLSAMYTTVSADQQLVILGVLQQAVTKDFDWDVQLNALTFWEDFVEREINTAVDTKPLPHYAAGLRDSGQGQKRKSKSDHDCSLLEKLCRSGVFVVLVTAVEDCDRSVSEKACQMLLKIKHKLPDLLKGDNNKKLKCDSSAHSNNSSVKTCEDFISKVKEMDLENRLSIIGQSSDEYVRNPVSLLDDILSSLSDDQNEDNIIDCY